jgi:putative hydrolase of the HAD superfamily
MIKAVLFDIGGTLHTVTNNAKLARSFAKRLERRLAVYDIHIDTPYDELAFTLHENAEDYKHWSEETLRELPNAKIWNEYYLKEYHIGEERLAPIAEELSFLYDYERVQNKRRPKLYETMEELHNDGLQLGIISNIISSSFVPHIVKEYGIDQFMDVIICSSDVGVRKPSPKIFEIALERLGLQASEMAYVGDTISRDVRGAQAAHLGLMIQIRNPAIAHRDVGMENVPPADFIIDELWEIPAIIRKVNEQEK